MLHLVFAIALQAPQATIVGTVTDATTREPLDAAVVELVDLNRSVVTDSTGGYGFTNVPTGPQHLTVHLVGYSRRTLHALVPASGRLVINMLLHAEPIPVAPVSVHAPVAMRGAERAVRGGAFERALSAAELRNHPLLAEPDAFQALSGGEVVIMPESPNGVHIRGGAADHTAYVLDGLPILNPYHAAGLFSAWNADALSAVRIETRPTPSLPDALAGVVVAESRPPGLQFSAQGSVTTTQTRATIDGPLTPSSGYLFSARSSYPGLIAPTDEGTYVTGKSDDLFARLDARVLGGVVRLLGYDSRNELATAAAANAPPNAAKNTFEWRSRSVGAAYMRTGAQRTTELRAWRAESHEQAGWAWAGAAPVDVAADRQDIGVAVTLELKRRSARTTTGVRAVRSHTSYDVVPAGATLPLRSLRTTTPVVTAFITQSRVLSESLTSELSATLAAAESKAYPALHAQLDWLLSEQIAVRGSVGRTHQFTQSLRNPESLAGYVFPVDLHVGAGAGGVPVARSDQVVLAAEILPRPGMRVALQGYARATRGLVVVAARDSQPFSANTLAIGSGAARGIAVEAALSAARFGVLATYGWQHTRIHHDDGSYVPAHGAAHTLEAGVTAFPSATTSIKLGAMAAFGRRASRVLGAVEWEACNLIDRGCEFAGSPLTSPDLPGDSRLPAYLRVDLGARKHWHVDVVGRDASFAVFATLTNVFGRKNVLNLAFDPATDRTTSIGMRPLSPLVAGIDWRF